MLLKSNLYKKFGKNLCFFRNSQENDYNHILSFPIGFESLVEQ